MRRKGFVYRVTLRSGEVHQFRSLFILASTEERGTDFHMGITDARASVFFVSKDVWNIEVVEVEL